VKYYKKILVTFIAIAVSCSPQIPEATSTPLPSETATASSTETPLSTNTPVATTTSTNVPNPFLGVWESTDIDGSHQTLTVEGQIDNLFVQYIDFGAAVCGEFDDNGPTVKATIGGTGLIVEGFLVTVPLPLYCHYTDGRGVVQLEEFSSFTLKFNPPVDGILIGEDGVEWTLE